MEHIVLENRPSAAARGPFSQTQLQSFWVTKSAKTIFSCWKSPSHAGAGLLKPSRIT
jgi:hypothetical protein